MIEIQSERRPISPEMRLRKIRASCVGCLPRFALYVKTKNFHCHISGRHFRHYRLPLDEESRQIFAVPRAKNERSIMLRKKIMMVVLTALIAGPLMAQEAKVTSLISKDLREFSGKEGLMITVEYPPGGSDPVHRHDAHVFVYVLEGSIVMQVKGGKEVTLTPGQTFYEDPKDVHVVSRNASKTTPAKFLVFFVKDKSAPVLKPVK